MPSVSHDQVTFQFYIFRFCKNTVRKICPMFVHLWIYIVFCIVNVLLLLAYLQMHEMNYMASIFGVSNCSSVYWMQHSTLYMSRNKRGLFWNETMLFNVPHEVRALKMKKDAEKLLCSHQTQQKIKNRQKEDRTKKSNACETQLLEPVNRSHVHATLT